MAAMGWKDEYWVNYAFLLIEKAFSNMEMEDYTEYRKLLKPLSAFLQKHLLIVTKLG